MANGVDHEVLAVLAKEGQHMVMAAPQVSRRLPTMQRLYALYKCTSRLPTK